MEITAHPTIPAYETLTGESVDSMQMFDSRYQGQFVDGLDGQSLLVIGGRAYDAAAWIARLDEIARPISVGRIADADAERLRDAGWPIREVFAAEERDLRPEDLLDRRKRLGVTQVDLARTLGVSANTIACWERGDKPIGNPRMLDLALRAIEHGVEGWAAGGIVPHPRS